jgi:ABC-type transporter Mla subunit MlaD
MSDRSRSDRKGQTSTDSLTEAAAESMKGGNDIRDRVRDLTLQAFQSRHFDYAGMKEVITAMTDGISLGAEQRTGQAKAVVADALSGIDQALMKSAQAAQLALQELASKSREFSDGELKQVVDQMKRLESDFLAAVSKAAESSGALTRSEFSAFLSHVQRVGTDTGSVVAQTMREFSHRIASQMLEAQAAGLEAAREVNARFADAASGFLQGIAESLRNEKKKK